MFTFVNPAGWAYVGYIVRACREGHSCFVCWVFFNSRAKYMLAVSFTLGGNQCLDISTVSLVITTWSALTAC